MALLIRTPPRLNAALGRALAHRNKLHNFSKRTKTCIAEWGYGSRGVSDYDSGPLKSPSVTRMAAGASHILIGHTDKDGSRVYVRGLNNSGQLGIGERSDGYQFEHIDITAQEILAIACGREHSMLLVKNPSTLATNKGSSSSDCTELYAFGNSMYGQLGLGRSKETLSSKPTEGNVAGFVFEPSPVRVQLPDPSENVVQVQCGLDHTVLRTDQGNLYSMGWGADGQLGLGPKSSSDRAVPTLIERLSWKARGKEVGRVKDISCSTDFTLALLEDNQLWIWGNSEYGQCMVNKKIDRILEPMHIPHPIPETEVIASVAAGGTFSLLLTQSGKVYTCGYGALGLGRDKTQVLMPEQITGLSGIRKIVASTDHAAAIDDKGHLYTWGTCGNTGRLGHHEFGNCYEPTRVVTPQEEDGQKVIFRDVALGQDGGLGLFDCE